MGDQPAIHAEGLSRGFGDIHALQDLNLTVLAGSVLGLLGPNGAGKTVRILTTLLRPDIGSARVAGLDVVRQPAAVQQVIGLAGQSAAVDDYLTGRENLVMAGRLHLHRSRPIARPPSCCSGSSWPRQPSARCVPGRRHAPPPGPGREPGRPSPGAVPGRAQQRP